MSFTQCSSTIIPNQTALAATRRVRAKPAIVPLFRSCTPNNLATISCYSVFMSSTMTTERAASAGEEKERAGTGLQAPTGSPSSNRLKDPLKQLVAAYHTSLVERPLLTKSCTSAIIASLGDILATWRSGRRPSLRRTLSFFAFGGLITAPLFHWWYGVLEKRIKLTGRRAVVLKVALDRILLTPPFLGLTLFTLRLLDSGAPRLALEGAKRAYPGTLATNYKVWTIAQLINFSYVPPAYRVLFGNVVALWWSFYLSSQSGKE